jgi:hypothetical protein
MSIPAVTAGASVTLVDGASFCISGLTGDIADGAEGLIVADRRLLSRCTLMVNGRPLVPVDHHVDDPSAATFVCRALDGPIVVRRRFLGEGMRDDVEIRNPSDEATYVEVVVELASDLATADALRDGRVDPHDVVPVLEPADGPSTGGGPARRGPAAGWPPPRA